MSASLTLTGLRDLVRAMDVLPAGLEDKASVVVREAAFDAAEELRSALALGPTGNLRKRVRVKRLNETAYQVISGAPHAFINEEGTKPRRTRKGANRGVSPASKTVARVAASGRRRMNGDLEKVLVQVLGSVR
jgi:hypothetical protein